MLRLYTFCISHFSEKARWALDYEGIPFEEKRLVPGPHMVVVRRVAPLTTVPVLLHEGKVIQGSGAILDYIAGPLGAKRLTPSWFDASRAQEFESRADVAFGLGTQRIFYDVLLADRKTVTDLWLQDQPAWARMLYVVAYPAIASQVRRLYAIRPDRVAEAKDLFRKMMDELDNIVRTRRYLMGDDPCRLDIAIASLLAPLYRPPQHICRWPPPSPETLTLSAEYEGRPTQDYVLRMYKEHRAHPKR